MSGRGRASGALAALLLLAARAPERTGTLTLDADAPLVTLTVAGVPLRLRVDLDQRDVVELNAAAAARLALDWRPGFAADLGGTTLPGRQASVIARHAGRPLPVILSTHGDCCAGADGAIGPLMLPYAAVRWVRAGPAWPLRRVAMTSDPDDGLGVVQEPVTVQLALGVPATLASRAAGVLLADGHGGRYAGPYRHVPGPFGVARPVRPVAFARPPLLLGFTVATLLVRTADFGGGLAMPEERARPGDLVVARRVRAQRRRPVVVLGREVLDGCTEIMFHAAPPTLDLACDPARPPAAG